MTACNLARAANRSDCDEQPKPNDQLRSSSPSSAQTSEPAPDQKPTLSKKRWFILLAVCIYGLCMTLSSDTSPILDQLLRLLDLNVDSYVYIGQFFSFLMAILAVPSAMFLDKFGIRTTMHVAACFFLMGGIFQSLLYFTQLPGWSHYKMYYYIAARIFNTESFAMFFLLPLKVSETWFSESERSGAWMLMFLQFEIGVCLVSFLFPRLIVGIGDFEILAWVTIACIIVAVISTVGLVTRSEPLHPPSVRAASKDEAPILESLKRMVKDRDIMLHMLHSSFFAASTLTIGSVLQNILSSIGHSQIFAGNYMLINSVISTILSIVMSCFVHKVNNPTLACKLGSLLQTGQFILLLVCISTSLPGWFLIGMSIGLTCLRSWTVPHFNNMTAHLACGVLSQPTMIGFSLAITPVIMASVQVTFAYLIKIQNKTNDYHNSLLFLILVCIINEAIYQVFFRGRSSAISEDNVAVLENGSRRSH